MIDFERLATPVSERLPIEHDLYLTDLGYIMYNPSCNIWYKNRTKYFNPETDDMFEDMENPSLWLDLSALTTKDRANNAIVSATEKVIDSVDMFVTYEAFEVNVEKIINNELNQL